jgi:hypothetical protein
MFLACPTLPSRVVFAAPYFRKKILEKYVFFEFFIKIIRSWLGRSRFKLISLTKTDKYFFLVSNTKTPWTNRLGQVD